MTDSVQDVPSADETVIRLMRAWTELNAADRNVDGTALRALVASDFVFRLYTGGGDRSIEDFLAMLRQQQARGTEVRSTSPRYRTFTDGSGGILQDTASVIRSPGSAPIEVDRCFVFQVADGRIAQIEEYVDPTTLRAP